MPVISVKPEWADEFLPDTGSVCDIPRMAWDVAFLWGEDKCSGWWQFRLRVWYPSHGLGRAFPRGEDWWKFCIRVVVDFGRR
eukprot:1704309-Pyramimonas_sp.AAC.1